MQPERKRLRDRRQSFTTEIEVGGSSYTATASIDEDGRVRELFLSGAKEGSAMDAILGDAAIIISVALQHGIPIEALGRSVGRIRTRPPLPKELDDAPAETVPASVIGAALDLLGELQAESDESRGE